MKDKVLRFLSYVVVAMLATAITLQMTVKTGTGKLDRLENLIQERYIGEADGEAMEDAAAAAMVKATGDRWSYYIPASQYEAHKEQSENAYVGIGITIQQAEDGSGFLIVMVNQNGPAQEAGIQVNDLLIAVEDQDVREMTADQVRELIRGEAGTKVSLTVMRQGEHQTLAVERRRIESAVATGQMLTDGIGLVKISNFDERCASESIAVIQKLQQEGAKKIIFDVRNNPGGYAEELVKLLDYLLPEGDLFRSVSYDGTEKVDTSDADCLDMPMAVLINGSSYSAAEFFAAALQEYQAATIVGEPTAVGLSAGKYVTPKGNPLTGVGVIPEVRVDVDEETAEKIYYGTLSYADDLQIQAAIQVLNR